jgi:hypothetical protein
LQIKNRRGIAALNFLFDVRILLKNIIASLFPLCYIFVVGFIQETEANYNDKNRNLRLRQPWQRCRKCH